jgi:hypothetical protein
MKKLIITFLAGAMLMVATSAIGNHFAARIGNFGTEPNEQSSTFFTDGTTLVPEPGTMMLTGIGMLGLAVYGKRRMNKTD